MSSEDDDSAEVDEGGVAVVSGDDGLLSTVSRLSSKQAAFGAFTRAFAKQNNLFEQAIQSLDSLNEQIVQFIFSPAASLASIGSDRHRSTTTTGRRLPSISSSAEGGGGGGGGGSIAAAEGGVTPLGGGHELAPTTPSTSAQSDREEAHLSLDDSTLPFRNSTVFVSEDQREQGESLKSSMSLMRRLLVDAQAKFRRMMEENKALASRIDGDIQSAHQEVSLLRAELADTNKRITRITNSVDIKSNGAREKGTVPPRTSSLARSSSEEEEGVHAREDSPERDRTKATNIVEPLSKKPPIIKRSQPRLSPSGKRSAQSSRVSSAEESPTNRHREKVGENSASSACSTGNDESLNLGAVNLMTGKSQDADDESADGDARRCLKCPHRDSTGSTHLEDKLNNLEEQNDQLNERIGSLQKELDDMHALSNGAPEVAVGTSRQTSSVVDVANSALASSSSSSSVTLKNPEVERLETELKHAKDALAALKADRKRLKAEKFDLLNQMKQLYGTLEDKEKELRDFIRNYEQRMRESDDNLKQLVREREDSEREKWNILKHARDEAERSVALCAQLGVKEAQVKQLQEELVHIREKLGYASDLEIRSGGGGGSCRSNGYRSPSANSSHTQNGRETPTPTLGGSDPTCSYDGTPTITVDRDSGCSPGGGAGPRGHHHRAGLSSDDRRTSLTGLSRSAEEIYNSSGSSDTGISKKSARRKRDSKNLDGRGSGTWGSISRVFSRSRQRKSLDPGFYEASGSDQQRSSWSPQSSLCASPLTEDSYTEKLKLLEEAQGQRMDRWKAATVLAWLEITLGMPQYGALCAENIKSGKILLELSDQELEAGLGVSNSMHRRKLRLAIEEHRDPASNPYPRISHLTHTWVVEEWLPSLGLASYADNFARQLVDGRVLETLSKKDLEKSLGVTRKFHQVSVTHAIQLLRMVKFDKQALQQRRSHSESMDVDPLVWTNQRFVKWAKSIDLVEYADNLRDSGVHGALVVLEASFQADTMATALGIPASKNIIRRHLTTELENLIQPARMSLEAEALVQSKKGDRRSLTSLHSSSSGSLGRNFLRSSSSKGTLDRPDNKRRSSMRGSLSRALGLKLEEELGVSSTQAPPPDSKGTRVTRDDIHLVSRYNNNFGQRRSLSASRVKLGSAPSSLPPGASPRSVAPPRSGPYLETMTVTPV